MKHDPIATKEITTEEALARWRDGATVWSISMGGLGPGYEQVIQIIAFTALEAATKMQIDWKRGDNDEKYAQKIVAEIEADPKVARALAELGPSGVQAGAALIIALAIARDGYAQALKMTDPDRHIQVNRTFPVLTEGDSP